MRLEFMKNVKGATKTIQFGIKPELKNKFKEFSEIEGTNKNQLFNIVFTDFFKEKLFNKKGVDLETPIYFNVNDLLKEKEVSGYSEPRKRELGKQWKIIKLPNNLDTWKEEYLTYCYNEKNKHLGVLPFIYTIEHTNGELEPNLIYIMFEYILKETAEVQISYFTYDELKYYLDDKNLLTELTEKKEKLEQDIKENGVTEAFKKAITFKYMTPLLYEKKVNTQFKIYEDFLEEQDNIIKDTKTKLEIIDNKEAGDILVKETANNLLNNMVSLVSKSLEYNGQKNKDFINFFNNLNTLFEDESYYNLDNFMELLNKFIADLNISVEELEKRKELISYLDIENKDDILGVLEATIQIKKKGELAREDLKEWFEFMTRQ